MPTVNIHIGTDGFIKPDSVPDAFFEQRLVAFDGQDIIGPLFYYFRCNVLLAAHCIDGHDAPFDIKQAKQLGDGRDLVAFLLRGYLPQAQPALGSESRNHVDGRVGLVVGVANALAIEGNHLLIVLSPQAVDPLGKTGRKLNGVNGRENPVDRVVRGDA